MSAILSWTSRGPAAGPPPQGDAPAGGLPPIDISCAATCNDEVADGTCDADADVIVSGREPRRRARRPGGLVWLLVIVQAVALAVAAAVALHYRAEVGRLHPGGTPAARACPVDLAR